MENGPFFFAPAPPPPDLGMLLLPEMGFGGGVSRKWVACSCFARKRHLVDWGGPDGDTFLSLLLAADEMDILVTARAMQG